MTPEAMRIEIFHACPLISQGGYIQSGMSMRHISGDHFEKFDPLNSLDAMRDSLETLDDTTNTIPEDVGFETQRDAYICNIEKVVGRDCAEEDIYWCALNATALQRAIAFLKTIGKYKED